MIYSCAPVLLSITKHIALKCLSFKLQKKFIRKIDKREEINKLHERAHEKRSIIDDLFIVTNQTSKCYGVIFVVWFNLCSKLSVVFRLIEMLSCVAPRT